MLQNVFNTISVFKNRDVSKNFCCGKITLVGFSVLSNINLPVLLELSTDLHGHVSFVTQTGLMTLTRFFCYLYVTLD